MVPALVIPRTFPSRLKRGPPELPGAIVTSSWRTGTIMGGMSSFSFTWLMIPEERAPLLPSGFPIATASCPIQISDESANVSGTESTGASSTLRTATSE